MYSNSIYGIPVYIISEKLLYDRTNRTNEIFHFDMYLVILSNKYKSKAFIPIYKQSEIMDILRKELLDKDFIL